MKKALSILLLLSGLNLHAQVQGQGSWIVGSLVNIFGTTNIPQKYVRFIPPPGQMLALGTNTVVPVAGMANITNGNFIVWLVGPFVYTADFGPIPGQGQATVPILVPNSSNTITFNVAAQLAVNSKMFPGTNIVININTNINSGTNYSIFTVTNGLNFYAGNAGILVQTNFNTNIAVSTTFLMSDVTNAIFPLSRIANSTNVFMTNGSLAGTWSVSSLSVASGTGAFSGTFNGQHQGDVSLTTGSPFATNALWATNLAGVAPSASNVLNVVGWTNLPSNVLSNQQAGVTFATTPSAQLTLTNSGTSRAAQLVATNVGAATQGIYVSSGSGGLAAVAASEFVGNLTGVATQATHATNADLATTASAVPWTGITGTPNLATNTYVGISNALGFAPATNGSSTGVAWTSITGTPNLATNTYVGISNALNFPAATNGGPVTISQVSNPNWATNSNAGITNSLGYIPLTNGAYGVTNALGFIPPPNTYVGISNALNFVAATNGGPINNGQIPSGVITNNDIGRNLTFFSPLLIGNSGFTAEFQPGAPIQFQGSAVVIDTGGNYTASGANVSAAYFYGNGSNLTKLNGSNVLAGTVPNSALQFTAATNNYAGITGALGFAPATNTYIGISNILGFQPATNGLVQATNAIGITSGSTGTNPVLFANPSGVNMTWTNPAVPLGIEPRVVGSSGLNIRSSGNVDNVTVQASKFSATGVPGVSGDGSGLNNVAAQSLASGAIVNNPIVTGGTFSGITIASGNGVGLTNVPAISMTGTITNPVKTTGDLSTTGNLYGSFNYTNLDLISSNAVLNTPTQPLLFAPFDIGDKNGHMTILEFGDSTIEYHESPGQRIMEKMLERYGYGGFISVPGLNINGVLGSSEMHTSPGTKAYGYIWTTTTGPVTINNGQDNPSLYWGPSQYVIQSGGTVTWTNNWVFLPGASQSFLNTGGQFPYATKAAVWYSKTNGAGQFGVLMSTNGGPFGLAATVDCSASSGVTLTTTNIVIQLSALPTTNYYQLMVTGIVGTVRVPMVGLWNEYAGLTHFKISQGGWQDDKYWHPEYDHNSFGGVAAQPAIPATMTNTHDNLFKDCPPDLSLISMVNNGLDTVGQMQNPSGTYTNLAFQFGDLSQSLYKFNPNAVAAWITQYPVPTNGANGYWPYQPLAMLNTFITNQTGHDYVYYVGKNISGERWTNLFGVSWASYPHWSQPAGDYVGNEIIKELRSWSYGAKTYLGSLAAPVANASAVGSYGVSITNNGNLTFNHGYSLSIGADIAPPAGSVGQTITAGQTHVAVLGYPTVDSTVPSASWLTLSTDARPVTTLQFGGLGPNGQAFNETNAFVFRNAGVDAWQFGGPGFFNPVGFFEPDLLINQAHSLYLGASGTIGVSNITATLTNSVVTINTNTQINGTLNVTGLISESSPSGWNYTTTSAGDPLATNTVTGAYSILGSSGRTNSGVETASAYFGDASSLSNTLSDSLYISATNFGVSGIYIQTNDAGNLANVLAFPPQDVALSNCLAYARSLKSKTTVRLPLGIIPITNAVWLLGSRVNLIGYGTAHSGGVSSALCLTNYSMLWQKNTNQSGLNVSMENAIMTLANFEVCGNYTNPLASLSSAAFLTAPIWSPKEGVTNASPFARVGIHARGLTSQYCGGVNAYDICVSGFRIGVVNWGNDELWVQPQLTANDIGFCNPAHTRFSGMSGTNPADLPINLNGYMSLVDTNVMPADSSFSAGSGWQIGVPDQVTLLHPSFGWRQGGLGYFTSRGFGNKIQQSCGIYGPKTYALLTESAPFLLDGGNDEPNQYAGTNWIYSDTGGSRITVKNWNVNIVPLGGYTNYYGDDLRSFSIAYNASSVFPLFDFEGYVPITGIGATNVFNAVCCPQAGGNISMDWTMKGGALGFQYYVGQYGAPITWPASSTGPNLVAGVNLQYELQNSSNNFFGYWSTNASGFPVGSNIPYGQLMIEKSTNGDYPFMPLAAGNVHQGTNALSRLLSSRPATPLEIGTYGHIPGLYDADVIGTGGTGFTPQSSKPPPTILPGGGMYMWNSNNLWLMASYTSGQAWGAETLMASFPFHATNVPQLAMVLDMTITNPANMTTALTMQDTWGGHSLLDHGGNFGTGGNHSWFTNNGIGAGNLFGGNEYVYFTNCWFNNNFSPEWVQPTTYFIVCTVGSAGNIDFIDNGSATGDRQQVQSASGLSAGMSCGSGTTFPVRTNVPIILECVFNAGQSYVRTNLAYSLTPGSFPFFVGGGQAGLSVGNNGAGSQYNYGNISYMLVYTNRLLKGWEETNIINWLNYSNRLTTGGPTNGGFHVF